MCACSFSHGTVPGDGQPDARPIDGPVDMPIDGPGRVDLGLLALYRFGEGSGGTVDDTAGVSTPVDLTIADPSKVAWGQGMLTITMPVVIASPAGDKCRIATACIASGGVTVEAWVIAAEAIEDGQSGQFARVVTMSINAGARNFAVGQMHSAWAAQLANDNSGVDGQGSPILSGGTVVTTTTQLVVTGDASTRKLYVDGVLVANDGLGGPLGDWNSNYRLAFGSEPSLSNPWTGSLLLVAIYDRALSDAEIATNFALGPAAP